MRVTMPTAGNAGGALAAYAAKAGMEATVFMPKDAPEANVLECRALGARLFLIEGLINDAGRLSQQKAAEEGLFDLSTLREPYRAEGKKTMALELAMDLGWRAPDVIVYPTGGGTGIVGMHKAFKELQDLGWIDTPQPKFVCIQAEGCQPLVKAFHEGQDSADEYPNASTDAAGLRVPAVFADYIILKVLRETGGTAIAVSDQEMIDAMTEMGAAEGVFAAPEGAATLVGLKKTHRPKLPNRLRNRHPHEHRLRLQIHEPPLTPLAPAQAGAHLLPPLPPRWGKIEMGVTPRFQLLPCRGNPSWLPSPLAPAQGDLRTTLIYVPLPSSPVLETFA